MEYGNVQDRIAFLKEDMIKQKAEMDMCAKYVKDYQQEHADIFEGLKALRSAYSEAQNDFKKAAIEYCELLKSQEQL